MKMRGAVAALAAACSMGMSASSGPSEIKIPKSHNSDVTFWPKAKHLQPMHVNRPKPGWRTEARKRRWKELSRRQRNNRRNK